MLLYEHNKWLYTALDSSENPRRTTKVRLRFSSSSALSKAISCVRRTLLSLMRYINIRRSAWLQGRLNITIPGQLFYNPLYLKTEQKLHHLLGRNTTLDDDLIHMLRLQRDPFVYTPFIPGKRPVVY